MPGVLYVTSGQLSVKRHTFMVPDTPGPTLEGEVTEVKPQEDINQEMTEKLRSYTFLSK